MMHADATWSGPGGWMKTIKRLVRFHHKGGDTKLPSRLWFILAIPSILVFIAWPLSGLAFETTSGFIRGTPTDEGPTMTGFSYSNFNERAGGDVLNGASLTWQYALDARVPGQGIVYTPEGVDQSRHTFLQKLPVVLPKDDGVSRIFLSAQAENPIEGNSWGVLLEYNCSIIERGSQLTVLNYRNATKAQDTLLRGSTSVSGYQAQNDSFIMIANETDPLRASWVSNMHAVIEVGYQKWPNASALERLQEEDSNAQFTKTQSCYFNQADNVTGDYPGVDQQTVFEVLLWQILFNSSYSEKAPDYNFTVDHNITDLYGAYDYRDFNYIIAKNDTRFSGQPMTAVGARCTSSSSVGTADIDGAHSTYSNFVRTDTPINVQINRCANRFGAEAIASIVTPGTGTEEWLSKFFTSAAAPPTFYAAFTDDPTSIDAGTGTPLQLSYLQAEQLRRSLLGAHAGYATQLMYNGGQGFTALDGSHVIFNNPNVTEYVAGTVLKLGTIPASVPASLFFAWAFVGPILGIIYGFRRRWSATLDGYSLFRLGADLPDDVKERMAMYTNTGEREECFELNRLPGLVGDTKPGQWLGHIGLVEGSVAAKDKKYQ
ncbi:hypothetical protein UCRPA7_7042 [Phaeoacremonium minimum UCRPA7]|uniref:Uncharacterized protein n=1 Tax=Phaeoacremonium minimum (strain UCR-PA7) TaxID=1286976 RepID=R8BEH3_PHAM7|nr:hypothetical protein UCRPA7_7042 [Phaeoacremonium minimum UCRPA7]EON97701.1 hypothetical protein UCRPA7_7042 [Phaeoacremonium minimum UCRPA7]